MESKKQHEYSKLILIGVIVIILIPIFIDYVIFGNDIKSSLSNGEWASFLGSYLGGVLGGIATLVAVLTSLNKGKTIQEESEIRENVLIVFYDLVLGLTDLKKLYIHQKNPKYLDIPSRMFFSNNWIKNVAVIANKLNNVDIIYKLYGDLETLREDTKTMSEFRLIGDTETAIKGNYLAYIENLSNKVFSEEFLNQDLNNYINYFDVELNIHRDLNETYKSTLLNLAELKHKYSN